MKNEGRIMVFILLKSRSDWLGLFDFMIFNYRVEFLVQKIFFK